ncbi:MAG TPA: hypothetical protein VLG49_03285 [Rhabdochlamydiaceae bacterium]|nr:hypothetical protein [Rhabdochlamydiaceae bacterium]HSX13116.1 hypothetical protein [Chlamydiales bacterium]
MKRCLVLEAIAKLVRPIKSPFCRHFSLRLLAYLSKYDLVGAARANMLALKAGGKIIDFLGHSSFATTSLACSLLAVSSMRAEEAPDFVSDQLSIGEEHIYTISSFDSIDYFCTYDRDGKLTWEIPFGSKIVAWRTKNESLFIFSRLRNGRAYFLTCIDSSTGELKWEKPIFAPPPIETSEVAEEASES